MRRRRRMRRRMRMKNIHVYYWDVGNI